MDASTQAFFAKFCKDPKESGVMLMEVGYYNDWTLLHRHVVIMKKNEWHAFGIISIVKLANNKILEWKVMEMFPITKNFKCDHEKSKKPSCEGAMLMKVIADDGRELFIEFDNTTKGRQFWNIVSQVKQVVDNQDDLFSDYSWIDKYKESDPLSAATDVPLSEAFPNNPDDPFTSDTASILKAPPRTSVGSVHDRSGSVEKRISQPNRQTRRPRSWIYEKEKYNSEPAVPTEQLKKTPNKDFRESEQTMMTLLDDMRNSSSDDMKMAYMGMRKREAEYMTADTHNIFIGTWNVNGKVDETLDLSDWLMVDKNASPPDIYAIGFQEMDLTISNAAFNKSTPSAIEEKWIRALEASFPSLSSKDQYRRLQRSRLAGIFLVIYCKQSIRDNIGDVAISSVPTGMFNVIGNKGAVGIRFRWHSTTICFICCHLAHGEGEQDMESRNRDYKYIANRMSFQIDRTTLYIDSHDLVYFFGDLNYRIEVLDIGTVKDLIKAQDYVKLHDYDELFRQIARKEVLMKFEEGPITFPPTYKFDINTDIYDTSEKHRTPSYCDRILWRGTNSRPVMYTSVMAYKMSDHKPVAANFELGVRRIIPDLARKTYMAVIRQMDVLHNLYLPKATLSSHSVDFGVLRFMEPKQDRTVLKNDGQTPFNFAFKPCPYGPGGKERLFPSWLTVTPQMGALEPSESIDITFEVYINSYTVADFNSGKEKVTEGTLILNLVGGRDLFITCEGKFQPTCFGLPLQTLIVMREPAAKYGLEAIQRMCIPAGAQSESQPSDAVDRQPFCFIKELWRLCNHIEKCGREEPGLFQTPGLHSEIQAIREALDTTPAQNATLPLPACSIHSVSEAMLLFLNSMPDSIIPAAYNPRLMRASKLTFNESVQVIRAMPKANRDVFHYLVLFMKRLLEFGSSNKLDSLVLASIFSEVLTRDIPPERRMEKIRFIQFFLDNEVKDLGY